MNKKHLLAVFGTTFVENAQAVEAGLRVKKWGLKPPLLLNATQTQPLKLSPPLLHQNYLSRMAS